MSGPPRNCQLRFQANGTLSLLVWLSPLSSEHSDPGSRPMASSSAVLSLSEAGISPQVGVPPGEDVLDPLFAPTKEDALLVIDVQCDFCSGGALEVPKATDIIPVVNALVCRFQHVVFSQDWHPPKHSSFASQHAGRKPWDEVTMSYGKQTLWPDHCIQGSAGSSFHRDLAIPENGMVCRKGCNPQIDSYSAFFENDGRTSTGLETYVQQLGVKRVFVVGVAFDFCVRFTCQDAATKCGLSVVLVSDGTKPVGLPGSVDATNRGLTDAGVLVRGARELGSLS